MNPFVAPWDEVWARVLRLRTLVWMVRNRVR